MRDRERQKDREIEREEEDGEIFFNFKLITFYLENNMHFKHKNKVLWPTK